MRNSIKIVLIIIILVVIGSIFYLKRNEVAAPTPSSSPSESATATPTASQQPISDLIHVTQPLANAVINTSKPLMIKGEARGQWYFEASFPVKLLDAFGNVLSQMPVHATGYWMTDNFVPFEASISFPLPATLTGTLVFQNDNPSGDPARSHELDIPLKFNIATTTVKAYFGSETKNPGATDCSLVYPVTRTVAKTTEVARAALEELLKGPTDAEKTGTNKYYTSVPMGVKIKSLIITNGVAKVDFDSTLEQNVGGSCRVASIRSQITQTLKQFSTVNSVIISINGRTEDILQP